MTRCLMRNKELANEGKALGVVSTGQPDVGPAAANSVGGLGEELAHGRGQVAQVGQRVGGGHHDELGLTSTNQWLIRWGNVHICNSKFGHQDLRIAVGYRALQPELKPKVRAGK